VLIILRYHHNNIIILVYYTYNNTAISRKIHSWIFGSMFYTYTAVVLLLREIENRIITINCFIKTTVVIHNIEKADDLGTFMIKVRTCATTLDIMSLLFVLCACFLFLFIMRMLPFVIKITIEW